MEKNKTHRDYAIDIAKELDLPLYAVKNCLIELFPDNPKRAYNSFVEFYSFLKEVKYS